MLPQFDVQGGVLLAVARTASVAALLSVFGTLMFRHLVAPPAFVRMPPEMILAQKRMLLRVTQGSIAACLLGTTAWLLVQAGDMADAHAVSAALAAVPAVLARTIFGHVIAAQLMVLVVISALAGTRDRAWRQAGALAVAVFAVLLQAGHSHAFSMYGGPSLLLVSDMTHLLGAGAWLGGLLPLLLFVRAAPPRAGAAASRWFSPMGKICVGALIASAGLQGWVLVGSVPGLVGTAYGWMILGKLAVFAVLLGLAAANRYRFAPALLQPDADAARRVLVRSLLIQTGFALAIVTAAVVLSALPPAMHEQAGWPFSQRISLAAVREDADFRREVLLAALALSGAAALLALAVAARRFRASALVLAVAVAWFAVPHFDLLFVQAYPTSFYQSPSGFTSTAIVEGQALYRSNCVSCHGVNGGGDGPDARAQAIPPADLTAAHLSMHSDGELFWWLTHGIDAPEGGLAMPGFAAVLEPEQRWQVIDFIRAHNAGHAMQETGSWPRALRAPALTAACGDRLVGPTELGGDFVRLVIGKLPAAPDQPGIVTIAAGPENSTVPPGRCVCRDSAVPRAYAIVLGLDAAPPPGTEFLIDDKGWLRAVQPAGAGPGWDDPRTLATAIAELRHRPMTGIQPAAMPKNMPM